MRKTFNAEAQRTQSAAEKQNAPLFSFLFLWVMKCIFVVKICCSTHLIISAPSPSLNLNYLIFFPVRNTECCTYCLQENWKVTIILRKRNNFKTQIFKFTWRSGTVIQLDTRKGLDPFIIRSSISWEWSEYHMIQHWLLKFSGAILHEHRNTIGLGVVVTDEIKWGVSGACLSYKTIL